MSYFPFLKYSHVQIVPVFQRLRSEATSFRKPSWTLPSAPTLAGDRPPASHTPCYTGPLCCTAAELGGRPNFHPNMAPAPSLPEDLAPHFPLSLSIKPSASWDHTPLHPQFRGLPPSPLPISLSGVATKHLWFPLLHSSPPSPPQGSQQPPQTFLP